VARAISRQLEIGPIRHLFSSSHEGQRNFRSTRLVTKARTSLDPLQKVGAHLRNDEPGSGNDPNCVVSTMGFGLPPFRFCTGDLGDGDLTETRMSESHAFSIYSSTFIIGSEKRLCSKKARHPGQASPLLKIRSPVRPPNTIRRLNT
jgi:hypothetical protein